MKQRNMGFDDMELGMHELRCGQKHHETLGVSFAVVGSANEL